MFALYHNAKVRTAVKARLLGDGGQKILRAYAVFAHRPVGRNGKDQRYPASGVVDRRCDRTEIFIVSLHILGISEPAGIVHRGGIVDPLTGNKAAYFTVFSARIP